MTNKLYCPRKFNIEVPFIANQKSTLWLFKSLTDFKFPNYPIEKKNKIKNTKLIQLTGKTFEPPLINFSSPKKSNGFQGNSNAPKFSNLYLKPKIFCKLPKNKFDLKNYKGIQENEINDNIKEDSPTKNVNSNNNIEDYFKNNVIFQNKKFGIGLKSEANSLKKLKRKSRKNFQSLERDLNIHTIESCSPSFSPLTIHKSVFPQISNQYTTHHENVNSSNINKFSKNNIKIEDNTLQPFKKVKFITNSLDFNQDSLNNHTNSKIRVCKSIKTFYKIHRLNQQKKTSSRNVPDQETNKAPDLRKTPTYNVKYSRAYKQLLSLRLK